MNRPVILDFDHCVGKIEGALSVDLSAWRNRLYYASRWHFFDRIAKVIDRTLPCVPGPVFLGCSGYHHISHALVARMCHSLGRRLTVVVIDPHPDNMRYPFGIHCNSWISHTAALSFVAHVHVIGITSRSVTLAHALQNQLMPLLCSKLTYWSTGADVRWAWRIGLKHAFLNFANIEDLVATFISEQYFQNQPVYLSVDKSALSAGGGQGVMEMRHVCDLIVALGGRLAGCDITGEVCACRRAGLWKRAMRRLERGKAILPPELAAGRAQQQDINLHLLHVLSRLEKSRVSGG